MNSPDHGSKDYLLPKPFIKLVESRNGSDHILSPPSWFIYSEKGGGHGVEICVCAVCGCVRVCMCVFQIAFFGYISSEMIKEL